MAIPAARHIVEPDSEEKPLQIPPGQEGPFYTEVPSGKKPPQFEYRDFVYHVGVDETDPMPRLAEMGDDGWRAFSTIRTGLEPSGISAVNGQQIMRRVFAFLMKREIDAPHKYEYAAVMDMVLPGQAYDSVAKLNGLGSVGWEPVVPPTVSQQQSNVMGPDGQPVVGNVIAYFLVRRKDSRYPALNPETIEQETEKPV